jgi:hypothetical protein
MLKHLTGGVVGLALAAGVASAQTYPSVTTPSEMGVPAPGRSTTTLAPSLHGGWQATTVRQGLDENGKPVTSREIYREGIAGSSESHMTTPDTAAGGTTR